MDLRRVLSTLARIDRRASPVILEWRRASRKAESAMQELIKDRSQEHPSSSPESQRRKNEQEQLER